MKLDNNWSIDSSSEGSTLIFAEKRIKNKGKENEQEFLFEDQYYYNNVESALKAYLLKSLENSKDVKDCINLIEETYKRIEKCLQSV